MDPYEHTHDDYGQKYYQPRGRFPMTTFDKNNTKKEINEIAYETGNYIMANDNWIARQIFNTMERYPQFTTESAFYLVLNRLFGSP